MTNASSNYDHNRKAGNEGDIFKHVALIAALDETVAHTEHSPFRYADIFAGYAMNPLRAGNEWRNGIGVVAGWNLLKDNRHVALWAGWWLDVRGMVGHCYPGSAWFAREVCAQQKVDVEMSLWDVVPAPLADLKGHFAAPHHVSERAGTSDEERIRRADFVFIDPPDKKDWASIHDVLRYLDYPPKQSVLVWLPICANTTCSPPEEDAGSAKCRRECLEVGMSATVVRWAKGGRVIGCQLLYRVNPPARQAVRRAVETLEQAFRYAKLKSGKKDSSSKLLGVRHFDPV